VTPPAYTHTLLAMPRCRAPASRLAPGGRPAAAGCWRRQQASAHLQQGTHGGCRRSAAPPTCESLCSTSARRESSFPQRPTRQTVPPD
jgi:hypothetical protein